MCVRVYRVILLSKKFCKKFYYDFFVLLTFTLFNGDTSYIFCYLISYCETQYIFGILIGKSNFGRAVCGFITHSTYVYLYILKNI